jgi:hypothetical protein
MSEEYSQISPLTQETREYLIEEMKARRTEISDLIKQMVDNQHATLIVVGAIWSWLATHQWQTAYIVVLFCPTLLTSLFWMRWRALEAGVFGNAAYIREIESKLNLQGFGWESWLKTGGRSVFGKHFALFHWGFWTALITGNLMLAFVYLIIH